MAVATFGTILQDGIFASGMSFMSDLKTRRCTGKRRYLHLSAGRYQRNRITSADIQCDRSQRLELYAFTRAISAWAMLERPYVRAL